MTKDWSCLPSSSPRTKKNPIEHNGTPEKAAAAFTEKRWDKGGSRRASGDGVYSCSIFCSQYLGATYLVHATVPPCHHLFKFDAPFTRIVFLNALVSSLDIQSLERLSNSLLMTY